jgi:5-methylcytosine-specific restriction endonuclease McrA
VAQSMSSQSKWNKAHPEKIRAATNKWRAANPEKFRASSQASDRKRDGTAKRRTQKNTYSRKRRKTHPEQINALTAIRRANRFQQQCGCCSRVQLRAPFLIAGLIKGHVDHKIPLALGGHHCVKNLESLTVEAHREKTKVDIKLIVMSKMRNRALKAWRV